MVLNLVFQKSCTTLCTRLASHLIPALSNHFNRSVHPKMPHVETVLHKVRRETVGDLEIGKEQAFSQVTGCPTQSLPGSQRF